MTADAKDLVNRMLTVDPGKRITAIGALNHSWIGQRETVASNLERPKTIDRLITFNSARRTFKAAVITYRVYPKKFWRKFPG